MYLAHLLKSPVEMVRRHQDRILLFLALILIGVLSFEAGLLYSRFNQEEKPLIISLPAVTQDTGIVSENQAQKPVLSGVESTASQSNKQCVFVGSKNSNKYHLPSCAPAKRIKPENLVCFASTEDAEKRGYIAGCLK